MHRELSIEREIISPFNLVTLHLELANVRKRKNVVMVIIRLVLLLKYTGILKLLSSLSSDECRCCLTVTPLLCFCRCRCRLRSATFDVVSVPMHACNHHHHHHHNHHHHYYYVELDPYIFEWMFWLPLKMIQTNV